MSITDGGPKDQQKPIQIVYRAVNSLRPDPKNPRHHSPKQIKQLARSIKSFGFNVPVAVDKDLGGPFAWSVSPNHQTIVKPTKNANCAD